GVCRAVVGCPLTMPVPKSRAGGRRAAAVLLLPMLAALVLSGFVAKAVLGDGDDAAQAAGRQSASESPSVEWSPPAPSEAWSPSEELRPSVPWSPSTSAATALPRPMFDAPGCDGRGEAASGFQPMLGRFGIVAPMPPCNACPPAVDRCAQPGQYSSQDFA